MRRILLAVLAVTIVGVALFFVPFLPMTYMNYGRGAETAWVSPSFGLFQCGDFVGTVSIQVADGGAPGDLPFWLSSSNWNCEFPHVMV